jgi:hypothetical protein
VADGKPDTLVFNLDIVLETLRHGLGGHSR